MDLEANFIVKIFAASDIDEITPGSFIMEGTDGMLQLGILF